ncbi:MAG: hypothetical protein RJB66_203 [Pseudomonadota bacterium]|jgi:hypothetical protein
MQHLGMKIFFFAILSIIFITFQNCSPSDQLKFQLMLDEATAEDGLNANTEEKLRPNGLIQPAIIGKEPAATKPFAHAKRPDAPVLLHQVFEVDVTRNPDGSIAKTTPQFYRPVRPAIPPVRTSHDGRLGFNWSNLRLYLLAPEKIDRPFPFSEPGLNILTDTEGWHSHLPYFLSKPSDPSDAGFAGGTICNHVKKVDQPRKCGINDCYDLTYVGFRTMKSPNNPNKNLDRGFFRSRQIIVEVENPKTAQARVRDVRPAPNSEIREKSQPIEIDYNMSNENFFSFEPVATTDGRLYVARMSFVPIKKIDGNDDSGDNDVDIYYMVAPLNANPCDASQFSYIKRIQKAPHDSDMKDSISGKARYGIAEYPMRDSFGNLIPENAMFPTYPWIDREGNNLFFASGGSVLFSYDWKFHPIPTEEPNRNTQEQDMLPNSSRYPVRCIAGVPNCQQSPYNPESPEHIRGAAVLGSWTHGKTVVLDGMINHIDYGLRRGLQFQREIQLYQPNGAFDGWVRAAAGRDTGPGGSGIDNQLESYSENAEIKGMSQTSNVIDSLENLTNTYRFLRPTLPRDLVWTVNNAAGSDEIVFDDYLDPRALIVSSMMAGVEFINATWARYDGWYYRDGFDGENDNKIDQQNRAILIQNAATSPDLPIPTYGHLTSGRVEPVALGGIHGRGLWLDGNNTLSYEFPRAVKSTNLFLSMFFDSRSANDTNRQLLSFPDGTKVLLNPTVIRFKKGDLSVVIPLPTAKQKWFHLGIAVAADGKSGSVYLNGMKKQSFTSKKSLFGLFNPTSSKGKIVLRIGKQSPDDSLAGFRGWIDELKLFAYIPTAEVICNHAFGSLHWLKEGASAHWHSVANFYEVAVHQEIFNQIPQSYVNEYAIPGNARFVCSVDYSDHMGIYRSLLREAEGLHSLREAILYATPKAEGGLDDGRLSWNANRIDYRSNAFCISCHTTSERRGLSLAALEPGQSCTMLDPRRQPLQSPLYLAGQVTEEQLRSIDSFHGQLNKFYDATSGALLGDPMLLLSRAGVSCGGFTPKSTLPSKSGNLNDPISDADRLQILNR